MILAIDPGLVTGWASYGEGDAYWPAPFVQGQVEGRHDFECWCFGLLSIGWVKQVVAEDFIIGTATGKKSRQVDPYYILGWLDGMCDRFSIPLKLQSPSEAKSFATDDKLKALGWYTPTPGGHANDAARHLLRYCYKDPAIQQKLMIGLGL